MIKYSTIKLFNNFLKILLKKDWKARKNKRIYFSKIYKKYNNNKIWKQKINWKFRWRIKKKHKGRNFKYYIKLFKKNKSYLKNKLIKAYLKKNSFISPNYKQKSIRQFLEMFNKIKRRPLSFKRQKRKKLKWYKAKYKQKLLLGRKFLLLSYKSHKLFKNKQKLINFKDGNKLKKYLKNELKNKRILEFFNKNKTKNKKWKFYWTHLKVLKRRRKWSFKRNLIKDNIKKNFLKYKLKTIRKKFFKELIKKIIIKQTKNKTFFLNQYGIKKNNKAYFKKEKDRLYYLNKKLNSKFIFNKNKMFFRRYWSYKIFDKIKKNYFITRKIIKFVGKNKKLFDKHRVDPLKLYNKIKSQNLLSNKGINNTYKFIKNKNNKLNLLKINKPPVLQKLLSLILIKKIKNIMLKKFTLNNSFKVNRTKYALKKLKFMSKIKFIKKNKHSYFNKKSINMNLFNSFILLKQKKQISYLQNLSINPSLKLTTVIKKGNNDIKKLKLLKKIKLLKKLDTIRLKNYIKNKKIINQKIFKIMQNLNKVSINKKLRLINKINQLNKQKTKIKHYIMFYKNRLKKKLNWLFRIAKRSNKLRKYNKLLKKHQFKKFIINKQVSNLVLNNYKNSNKLKVYSYNLGRHIDNSNKWMNYYIRKSFKWKFFKKRWHYRYSKWKKLLYFKKLMQRAKNSYRKLQKNFIFIKLFRANFNNFMGINEKDILNKWLKLRRGDNHNDNVNTITRFNQMLQLKLDGLVLFLGLAPSRFLAQEFIKCGGLRVNGIIITNINHFINLNNILQIDLQIKEDLKLFYASNHWIKVKTRLKYVEFLQVMWPMMMFMLIRWPHNYELYEDSILTSRWLRFFIRYFPIRISKYKKSKVKWYKY